MLWLLNQLLWGYWLLKLRIINLADAASLVMWKRLVIFIGKDHLLLLLLLVRDRLVNVIDYAAHLRISRLMHPNFFTLLMRSCRRQLKRWYFVLHWLRLKAEDVTALVLFVAPICHTDIIVSAISAAHISVLLPGARASLRLFLALCTIQILPFLVHLIFEETARGFGGRIDHADAFGTAFFFERRLEFVRPNVKGHVRIIVLITGLWLVLFMRLFTATIFWIASVLL